MTFKSLIVTVVKCIILDVMDIRCICPIMAKRNRTVLNIFIRSGIV